MSAQSGIESATCVNVIPTTPGALNAPRGIAFNGNYVYIINGVGQSYTQCSVSSESGIESATCETIIPTTSTLSQPSGIAFNESYAYINNAAGNNYTQCNVSAESGIESASCITVTPSESGGVLSTPIAIAFNESYAYITNGGSNPGNYTQCSVSAESGIESATCVNVTPTAPGALTEPSGIAFYGNYAYINTGSGIGDSYTQCSVGESGIESATCVNVIPTGALSEPAGIAFFTPS